MFKFIPILIFLQKLKTCGLTYSYSESKEYQW